MSPNHSPKPKMLIVDDEPDNLDLLYRTFRRDFKILRAEGGSAALEVLASEGEVAVIISDQRMPEMKGTEFLSKTVPQFPDTIRIILTGFTDVEDLVEAINSGQVYRYLTKPWQPAELKQVVQRATETYELLKQRTEELHQAQAQIALLQAITQVAQQSDSLESGATAIDGIFQQTFAATDCKLCLDADSQTDQLQIQPQASDPAPTQLVLPVTFRGAVLAVLSLQWPQPPEPAELALIQLAVPQVGVALACLR